MDVLRSAWSARKTALCIGLDSDREKLPPMFKKSALPIFTFNKAIIDATHDLVCAYKPQIAYYAAQEAEEELRMTIEYIQKLPQPTPVILDFKRGDIGETASLYAREGFDRYKAEAVTVNPYMGGDTLQPYLERADNGVFVLCKTSNPGSGEFQDLQVNGKPVYEMVAEKAAREWNKNKNVGLVVGGTHIEALKRVRAIVGDMPLLVPGVGAQGGDLQQILKHGRDSKGQGLVVNASRSIIYASNGEDFESAARKAALAIVESMRSL